MAKKAVQVDSVYMTRSHKANSRPDGRAYFRLSSVQLCRPLHTFVPGILG